MRRRGLLQCEAEFHSAMDIRFEYASQLVWDASDRSTIQAECNSASHCCALTRQPPSADYADEIRGVRLLRSDFGGVS